MSVLSNAPAGTTPGLDLSPYIVTLENQTGAALFKGDVAALNLIGGNTTYISPEPNIGKPTDTLKYIFSAAFALAAANANGGLVVAAEPIAAGALGKFVVKGLCEAFIIAVSGTPGLAESGILTGVSSATDSSAVVAKTLAVRPLLTGTGNPDAITTPGIVCYGRTLEASAATRALKKVVFNGLAALDGGYLGYGG